MKWLILTRVLHKLSIYNIFGRISISTLDKREKEGEGGQGAVMEGRMDDLICGTI